MKDTANKVWLAGLGAVAMAEEEGGKLFKDLVSKGKVVRGDRPREARAGAEDKVETMAGVAKHKVESATSERSRPRRRAVGQGRGRVGRPHGAHAQEVRRADALRDLAPDAPHRGAHPARREEVGDPPQGHSRRTAPPAPLRAPRRR
jgi:polyhydroxyalkanoate synthesis regulator phasin